MVLELLCGKEQSHAWPSVRSVFGHVAVVLLHLAAMAVTAGFITA